MICITNRRIPPMRSNITWYGFAIAVALLNHGAGICAEKGDDRLSPSGKLAQARIAALRGVGAQSGPNCFNAPDCEEEGPIAASQLQAETSIAVDSTGQHIVIGFNDFRGFNANQATKGTPISGFSYSDDGGATFVDGGR